MSFNWKDIFSGRAIDRWKRSSVSLAAAGRPGEAFSKSFSMSRASSSTLSPSRSCLRASLSWALSLSSSVSGSSRSRRAFFSFSYVSLWSSDRESKMAHARPRRSVGRRRSCFSASHSLALAQTSNHLNQDLASLSWRGSGRARPTLEAILGFGTKCRQPLDWIDLDTTRAQGKNPINSTRATKLSMRITIIINQAHQYRAINLTQVWGTRNITCVCDVCVCVSCV